VSDCDGSDMNQSATECSDTASVTEMDYVKNPRGVRFMPQASNKEGKKRNDFLQLGDI
jgi:hypothetical protein